MRAVSDRFLSALSGSNLVEARVRATHPRFRTGGVTPAQTPPLPLLSGSITLDGTADERGRLDIEVAPYWPDSGQDPQFLFGQFATTAGSTYPGKPLLPAGPLSLTNYISPLGSVLLVEVGVEYGNGAREYVQLGYYRIESVEQDDEPDGPIRIVGRDLMSFLIDSRLVYDQNWSAGTTMQTIFQDLAIHNSHNWYGMPPNYANSDLDLDPTFAAATIDAAHTTDGDRFKFLDDLVRSRDYIWYFDQFGKIKVTSTPDPTSPVLDIAAGTGGTLLSTARRWTREGVYNIVSAESSDLSDSFQEKAVVFNQVVTSPTYIYGFGFVPLFYTSPFILTDAAAISAAQSRLDATKGVPFQRTLTTVPNAALEPFDPIRVWPYGTDDESLAEIHVIESITLPLVSGSSTIKTREWKII